MKKTLFFMIVSLFGVLCFLAQGRRGASTSVHVAEPVLLHVEVEQEDVSRLFVVFSLFGVLCWGHSGFLGPGFETALKCFELWRSVGPNGAVGVCVYR